MTWLLICQTVACFHYIILYINLSRLRWESQFNAILNEGKINLNHSGVCFFEPSNIK